MNFRKQCERVGNMRHFDQEYCHRKDTEYLTQNGWKKYKDIENDISKELKQILIEDVRILINSSFHEGYCPDRSPFEKIPNEIRDRIYSEYF